MCEFCDTLKQEKEMKWYKRNTSSLDNSCEFVNDGDCGMCDRCDHRFAIKGLSLDDDVYVKLSYYQKVYGAEGDMIVDTYSESMLWVYCPICGKRLSKNDSMDELSYPLEIMDE